MITSTPIVVLGNTYFIDKTLTVLTSINFGLETGIAARRDNTRSTERGAATFDD